MKLMSAPGKLVLLGDYAVLNGGRAMVGAVSRRAVGRVDPAVTPSAVVQAVMDQAIDEGRSIPGGVAIETGGFQDGSGCKLGIGSSAAVAVVTAGLILRAVDEEALQLAWAGHRRSAGGIGSGIDVAASFHGGIVVTHSQPAPVTSLKSELTGVHMSVLYANQSASTRSLVRACREAPSWLHWTSEMRTLTERGVSAWERQDVAEFISVVGTYGEAMDGMGRDAGVEVVTPTIRAIMNEAASLGAAAKPSGAGGGDVVVVFARDRAASAVIAERTGTQVLEMAIDGRGLSADE